MFHAWKHGALAIATASCLTAFANAQWSDGFESYPAGSALEGQGGWHDWDGMDGARTTVESTFAHGGAQSIRVRRGADTVQEYAITSGQWIFSGWLYVPTGTTGTHYWIMMNEYNVGGPHEWSVQVRFNANAGRVECDCGSATPNMPALVFDRWAQVRAEIDLDGDSVSLYYDDNFIATYLWSEGPTGADAYLDLNIEALNLYPDPITIPDPMFWDSFSLVPGGDLGVNYCTANPSSTGAPALMSAQGSTSVALNTLELTAEPVPNQPFIFFFGPNQIQVPFGNGFLCAGGGLTRILPPGAASGNRAVRSVDLPTWGIVPGTRNFQCWFRDPAGGGAAFNTSDGLSIVFVP